MDRTASAPAATPAARDLSGPGPRPAAGLLARYRKLVFLAWFLTLDLIMFGAFVRLTDSGLGCPDWPGCYGHFSPLGAGEHIRAALEAMPYGPVSAFKAWIEMIHRYAGAFLGLMIIAIALCAFAVFPCTPLAPLDPPPFDGIGFSPFAESAPPVSVPDPVQESET